MVNTVNASGAVLPAQRVRRSVPQLPRLAGFRRLPPLRAPLQGPHESGLSAGNAQTPVRSMDTISMDNISIIISIIFKVLMSPDYLQAMRKRRCVAWRAPSFRPTGFRPIHFVQSY